MMVGRLSVPKISWKSRMVESESGIQKFEGAKIDWNVADVTLLRFALWYLVFQFALDWIVYFIFSESVALSRLVHSYFVELDQVTPALAKLKLFYRSPIRGREFSQVFAIYFCLLALLCPYLVGLCGLLLNRKIRNHLWRQMFARNYALPSLIFAFLFAFGFGEIYFFLTGPSSLRNYLGIFGTDFITSICLLLPTGQFLILCPLAFYYAIGEFHAKEANRQGSLAD